MKLTDEQVTEALKTFIDECDADELARLAGEIFGGNCTWFYDPDNNSSLNSLADNSYNFEPNENYYGEFDDYEE